MKNKEIKIKLERYASSNTYVITQLTGAIKVYVQNNEHRVGDTLIEKEAELLSLRYTVTVIAA